MFQFGEPDPWSWQTTDKSAVNFLVWVLLDDGLRVAPFDAHPEGSGRLRAAGMEAADWRFWLDAVVTRYIAAQEGLEAAHRWSPDDVAELRDATSDRARATEVWRRQARRRTSSEEWQSAMEESLRAGDPLAAWPGGNDVKALLGECFGRWQEERKGDPDLLGASEPAAFDHDAARQHVLYTEFRAMSPRPSTLSVHVVRYVVPVVEPVPPVTLVVGRPDVLPHEVYEDLLRRGVRQLVGTK